MRIRKTKKTFVLLELLIGFALVSISILPFLRYPYLMMKKEIDFLFEMEMERKVESELCALFDYAIHLNIKPEELFAEGQKTLILKEEAWTLTLTNQVSRNYDIVWKVTREKYKLDDKHHYALANLKVKIYPKGKRGKTSLIRASSSFIAQKKR